MSLDEYFDAGNNATKTVKSSARIATGGSPVFQHIAQKIQPSGYFSRVKSITIRLCVTDCTGDVYFTDILLQGGSVATGWVGHVCEIQWTLDG